MLNITILLYIKYCNKTIKYIHTCLLWVKKNKIWTDKTEEIKNHPKSHHTKVAAFKKLGREKVYMVCYHLRVGVGEITYLDWLMFE